MTTVSTPSPIVRAHEEGERRWFYGGGVHTWKAKSEETGGAFLLFEDEMEQGKTTPLHLHPDSDETMYLLEGEILIHMDGREHRVSTGGLTVAPRGVPHAFMVLSTTARMLCLHTPGCAQSFYLDASEPMGADNRDAPAVDFSKIAESEKKNGGIEILGPPPFARG